MRAVISQSLSACFRKRAGQLTEAARGSGGAELQARVELPSGRRRCPATSWCQPQASDARGGVSLIEKKLAETDSLAVFVFFLSEGGKHMAEKEPLVALNGSQVSWCCFGWLAEFYTAAVLHTNISHCGNCPRARLHHRCHVTCQRYGRDASGFNVTTEGKKFILLISQNE